MDETQRAHDCELTEKPSTRIEDLRRFPRKDIRLVARIELPDGEVLEASTADISRGGIGFFSPRRIDIAGDCTLTVAIDACGASAMLKLVGRVCHCTKQAEDSFRIGMQFVRMDETTASILYAALR